MTSLDGSRLIRTIFLYVDSTLQINKSIRRNVCLWFLSWIDANKQQQFLFLLLWPFFYSCYLHCEKDKHSSSVWDRSREEFNSLCNIYIFVCVLCCSLSLIFIIQLKSLLYGQNWYKEVFLLLFLLCFVVFVSLGQITFSAPFTCYECHL